MKSESLELIWSVEDRWSRTHENWYFLRHLAFGIWLASSFLYHARKLQVLIAQLINEHRKTNDVSEAWFSNFLKSTGLMDMQN